jgi:hypothetical protein
MLKKYVFTFVIMLLLLLIFINGQSGCKQETCYKDEDCVKVQMTCCPCSAGGQEICVQKAMEKAYQDKLKSCENDSGFMCPQVYQCKNISCFCNDGKCDQRG